MSDELLCGGCGVKLQSHDKDKLGFVPSSAIEQDDVLCRRCFRLKHYNENVTVSLTDDDFLTMINEIRMKDGLIVHIVDLFDVDGTLIQSLPRYVGDNPILLVGNKLDLLPKSTNHRKLTHWLRSQVNEAGIKIEDVCLISSVKGDGMNDLINEIETYRKGRDVYIVGVTNVGKSTFINEYIKRATGLEDVITTSYFPGTTLGFIEVPLDNNSSLIDTPGIVNQRQIVHYVSEEDLHLITPRKEVKSRVYQLESGQTLFIGGLARFDFIKGEKQSFVCHFSNRIQIHRTKTENADQLYERHLGELLSPPSKKSIDKLPPLIRNEYRINETNTDIVFPGLGWITVKEKDSTIAAHSPQDVSVSLRSSFIEH